MQASGQNGYRSGCFVNSDNMNLYIATVLQFFDLDGERLGFKAQTENAF